ncbi:MAG TPA: sugar phosphate isomerase/epimerase [Gemmatimonadales bacterium]|nr:sugar phosphate isomerase/epimerase [Gemmatimonadales bacterium]
MRRRDFLATGCATLGAGFTTFDLRPWTFDVPPAGLQLYSLRTEMQRDVEGTLRRLGALGYREVEFAGYFGRTPAQVRDAVKAAGLTAPAAHIPLEALDGDALAATADAALEAGHAGLIVAWLPAPLRGSLDAWRAMADRFNDLGRRLGERNLHFAYHNHEFEFAPLDGRVPYEVLLERADPALVGLELDLYWATKAGHDPLALVRAHPGRFPLVHVKDASPAPELRQVDVGTGTIDFAAIFAAGKGIRHAFIEHDQPADPWAFAAASLAAYRKLGA